MSLKILVDVNLSPDWVNLLESEGWPAAHWTAVGDPRAEDHMIMAWAQNNGYIVLTHDLDFGTLLALTNAQGPSVIQVRAQDVLPDHLGPMVVAATRQFESVLESGALVVVDESRARARVLPIMDDGDGEQQDA